MCISDIRIINFHFGQGGIQKSSEDVNITISSWIFFDLNDFMDFAFYFKTTKKKKKKKSHIFVKDFEREFRVPTKGESQMWVEVLVGWWNGYCI